MTEKDQIYRCNQCGNIVEVVHLGTGKLVCCNNQMELLKPQKDVGPEKHIPLIQEHETSYKISIGKIPHPMEDNHCIEWVELITPQKIYRKFFQPGDKPVAEFQIVDKPEKVKARQYCSIHGIWVSE